MTENDLPWKTNPKNMGNRLHTLCSYMAMFPPSIPNYYIQKYSQIGDTVLDQFSGRGTAPLEACALGRVGIGSDKSPLAYVLTKSKVQTPNIKNIVRRVYALWNDYKKIDENHFELNSIGPEIRMLFSNYTLKQLLFLQENLDWKKSSVDSFIAAMVLGIMHGGSIGYLSISMPNTFSMSSNYIKQYIKNNNLQKHQRNTFELLLKKLDRCYQLVKVNGKTYLSDARQLGRIDDETIDFSITSPPYT